MAEENQNRGTQNRGNPNRGTQFSKEDFMKNIYGPYQVAEELMKNPGNSDLVPTLDAIVRKEKPDLAPIGSLPAHGVDKFAKKVSADYQGQIMRYVGNNMGKLVRDVLNKENAIPLMFAFEPNQNGKEERLVKEIKQGKELMENAEKDPQAMEAIAQEIMKYSGEYADVVAYIIMSGDSKWVVNSYGGILEHKTRDLVGEFSNEEGKLNLNKVAKYVSGNLKATPKDKKQETYMKVANMVAGTYSQEVAQEQEAGQEGSA